MPGTDKTWQKSGTTVACLLLTFSLVLVPVLSTPLPVPLIITFGDSNAVHTAERAVASRVLTVSMDYENPLKSLYLVRARPLIIIGHGGAHGSANNKLVTWANVKHLVQGTPAMQNYILSCNSYGIAEKLRAMGRHAFGFNGPIDAEIAGLVTALSIIKRAGASSLYQTILLTTIRKVFKKLIGIEEVNPLYWMKGKVFKGWLGIPYRWQVWYKFTSIETENFLYDLTAGAAAAAIAAAFVGGILAAAVTVANFGGIVAQLSQAASNNDGRLEFFFDTWGFYVLLKTWFNGESHFTLSIPQISLGTLQSQASILSSSYQWQSYYSGVL